MGGALRLDEPLRDHTTFRVGGPADVYAQPRDGQDVAALIAAAAESGLPWIVVGGGSNILVSERGVRGLVIDTTGLDGLELEGTTLTVGAGLQISDASACAADHSLAGLEFIYSMPGTAGGAVWMNARCYGGEISEVLASVTYFDSDGREIVYTPRAADFAYKRSPFMDTRCVMTSVSFALRPGDATALWHRMREHEADRRSKGHFDAPCAGSVFKNNRAFGRPSGAIIDSIGLRGFRTRGAKVSDLHANIVVNTGDATADDIRDVIEHIHAKVLERLGIDLEPEVIYVGDWSQYAGVRGTG